MDRKVRVRRPPGMPFTAVYSDPPPGVNLEKLQPNFYMSRIWIDAVPEETTREAGQDRVWPAYACVLGEVWDDDPLRWDRPRILLDEATALDPKDFTDAECEKFRITEKESKYPTIVSLRKAVVALKDIWWPSRIVVPPDESFFRAMLLTDALYYYEPRISDGVYARKYPFFKTRNRVADQGVYKIETENRIYNERLTDAMFSQDLLEVVSDFSLFPKGASPPAFRCIGMLINEMQRVAENSFGSSDRVRDPLDDEAEEELAEQQNIFIRHEENLRHLFGGEVD